MSPCLYNGVEQNTLGQQSHVAPKQVCVQVWHIRVRECTKFWECVLELAGEVWVRPAGIPQKSCTLIVHSLQFMYVKKKKVLCA